MPLLQLPSVTLCAVTSVNVAATIAAMRACQDQVQFADAILLTDAIEPPVPSTIRHVGIGRLTSSGDYSDFLLRRLADHVRTDHALVVQWDGFVLDARRWDPAFLDFDFIGAPWPQFEDAHNVGNGGFSLRSQRLLRACQDPRFADGHPEDIAIGRLNRAFLEDAYGCRFPPAELAERFSYERTAPKEPSFGFHGVFNMIPALGADRFWKIYNLLDERTAADYDYVLLMRQLGGQPDSLSRRLTLSRRRLASLLKHRIIRA